MSIILNLLNTAHSKRPELSSFHRQLPRREFLSSFQNSCSAPSITLQCPGGNFWPYCASVRFSRECTLFQIIRISAQAGLSNPTTQCVHRHRMTPHRQQIRPVRHIGKHQHAKLALENKHTRTKCQFEFQLDLYFDADSMYIPAVEAAKQTSSH